MGFKVGQNAPFYTTDVQPRPLVRDHLRVKEQARKFPTWLTRKKRRPRPLQIRALNGPKGQTGRGLGNVVKAVASNPYAQEVEKRLLSQGINYPPKVYKRATGKIKNKNLKALVESDAANYIVNKTVEKGFERLV